MSKELNPKQIERQNTEQQHFDAPLQKEILKEDAFDMRQNALMILRAGRGSLEFKKDGDNRVSSVTVKKESGETIFFSREPQDIEVFLEIEALKDL